MKGGLYLTDWHRFPNANAGSDNAHKAVVGPFVRFKLPLGLGVQIEALVRDYNVRRFNTRIGYRFDYRASGSAWEFPLLLVYRVPVTAKGWTPVLSAGPAWRLLRADSTNIGTPTLPGQSFTERRQLTDSDAGFQIGGGAEWSAGPITISAEARYARWWVTQELFPPPNRNQAVILVGARWR